MVEDVIASLLPMEVMIKLMEVMAKDALSIRGHSQERNNRSLGNRSKSRGRYKSLGQYLRKCWKYSKVGIIRNISYIRMLIKVRDMMMFLP